MVSKRSDQADPCDSCRFRHQESHIQRVTFKVGQELQGDRVIVPPIRSNYGIKYLSNWSQLVDPMNLGTFVVINAAGLGQAGGVHVAGVGGTSGHQVGRQVSLLRARRVGSRLCSYPRRQPIRQPVRHRGWQLKTERFRSGTTIGAESMRQPLDGCGGIYTNSSRVHCYIYRHGLRCRTGSTRLASDNLRICGFVGLIISGCI